MCSSFLIVCVDSYCECVTRRSCKRMDSRFFLGRVILSVFCKFVGKSARMTASMRYVCVYYKVPGVLTRACAT